MCGKATQRRMFNLVSDVELLRQKIAEVGNVVLIFIDPVSATWASARSTLPDDRCAWPCCPSQGTRRGDDGVNHASHFNKEI